MASLNEQTENIFPNQSKSNIANETVTIPQMGLPAPLPDPYSPEISAIRKKMILQDIPKAIPKVATGVVTGTLGLPSDMLDLATFATEMTAKFGDDEITSSGDFGSIAKAILPKIQSLQEKYGRDAFDKMFTELTGVKSDASDPAQIIGELISLGSAIKYGAKGVDAVAEGISTVAEQTKKAFQPQAVTPEGIAMPIPEQPKGGQISEIIGGRIGIDELGKDPKYQDSIKQPEGLFGEIYRSEKGKPDAQKLSAAKALEYANIQSTHNSLLENNKFDEIKQILSPDELSFIRKQVFLKNPELLKDLDAAEKITDTEILQQNKNVVAELLQRKRYAETGVYVGRTGETIDGSAVSQIRFEIPDVDASLNTDKVNQIVEDIDFHGYDISSGKMSEGFLSSDFDGLPEEIKTTTLGELLNHDMLYAAYGKQITARPLSMSPKREYESIKDMRIEITPNTAGASYYRNSDIIKINPKVLLQEPEKIKSLLLHEVQHAVQGREGFESGASRLNYYTDGFAESDFTKPFFKRNYFFNEYKKLLKKGMSDSAVKTQIDLIRKIATQIDANSKKAKKLNLEKIWADSEPKGVDYIDGIDWDALVTKMVDETNFVKKKNPDKNTKKLVELAIKENFFNKVDNIAGDKYYNTLGELEATTVQARDAFSTMLKKQGFSREEILDTLKKVSPLATRDLAADIKMSRMMDAVTEKAGVPVPIKEGTLDITGDIEGVYSRTTPTYSRIDEFRKRTENVGEESPLDVSKQTDNLPELRVDNPGKDFKGREYTDKKIESALEDKNKAIAAGLTETDTATVNIGNFSGQTAFFTKPVRLDPKMLKDVKGMMGEHKTRNKSRKLELLKKSIKEKGYEESPILIHVREDGVPFVTEGNHRLAEAIQSNRESIPVEIKYLRGAENVEGILNPKTLGLKNKTSKQTDDMLINMLGDEGIGAEHPNIQEAVNKYVYDVDKSSIEKAIASPDYPSYKADLQRILKKEFPDGKIPVTRILNYASRPDGKKPKKVKSVLDIEDIAFAGNEAERELIANLNGDLTSFSIDNIKKEMNRGGVPTMQKKNIESQQLELFGGMKDQGGTKDPVSGNDVPVGSTKKEGRDDIPAQLSEGEFVLPADVVRYHGLEKIMGLRDQAKQGLNKMEAMGQMGNSDEATLPDDTPFMAQAGGVAGVNVQDPAELTKKDSIFKTRNPYGQQPQMPPPFMPIIDPPTPPKVEAPEQTPRTFEDTMGGVGYGQLQQQVSKLYKNNKTGETRVIPFVNGKPIYPIPAGFVPIEEAGVAAPETGVDTAKVDTTRVTEDKDRDRQTASGATGSFNLGDIDFAGIGLGLLNPLLGIGYQALKRQKGDTDLTTRPPEFGPPSARRSPTGYSALGNTMVTGQTGTNVGDKDINTGGTFNNSFAVDTTSSDLHTYGGAKRNEQGHTIYRTINEQVKSLKSAAKTGWFGGPLSAMEYQGLTDDAKKRYNMFTQEFKRLGGDIDSQIYGTIDENGNLVNSDNYNQYLNAIKNENVSGTNKIPPKEGDGYLVSDGKAYKGTYTVNKTTGDMQFEKVGGGTIISSGGSGLVGDLTGSGQKTKPATGQDRPPEETKQDAAMKRKQEADKARAEANAYAKQLEAKAKAAAEAEGKRKKAELAKQIRKAQEEQRKRDEAEQRRRDEAEANRKERAGITSRGKKVDTASLRGTGRRGGRGIVRAKGGLMTKPAIKNMKRGGLASR